MKKQFKISDLKAQLEDVRFTQERIYCENCEGAGTFTMLDGRKCKKCNGVGWAYNPEKIVLDENVQFQITPSLFIESQSILQIIQMAEVSGDENVSLSTEGSYLRFELIGGLKGKIKEAFWLYARDIRKLDFN